MHVVLGYFAISREKRLTTHVAGTSDQRSQMISLPNIVKYFQHAYSIPITGVEKRSVY